jgi:hypothetical protein
MIIVSNYVRLQKTLSRSTIANLLIMFSPILFIFICMACSSLSLSLSLSLWLDSPLDLCRFCSFLILYAVGRTLRTEDQPVVRRLPTYGTTQTQNKRTQTSIILYSSILLHFSLSVDYFFVVSRAPSCCIWDWQKVIDTNRHPCLEWDSNPRLQCSRRRRRFML